MPLISVVAPVYNELPETLRELARLVDLAVTPITADYEIVLVDDAGPADPWPVIVGLSRDNSRIRGVRLTRNFGQQAAIMAGVDHTSGDWVVVMDADLQDRPEVIPDLYHKAKEGYDVVFVDRVERPESLLYRAMTACFYYLLNLLSGQEYNRLHSNFSIASRKAINSIRFLRESTRFYGGQLRWLGFSHTSIQARSADRHAGRTGYNLFKRARFGFELMVGFSTRLLYISTYVGMLMAVGSFVAAGSIITSKLLSPEFPLPGWPSVMTAVFFTAGVTNVAIGLLGIYLARTFEQTKLRPIYVVDSVSGPVASNPDRRDVQ